ncbi:DUF4199 domain-containing protein [Flagellimonas sp. HMM57]|uniref:DUF4199 domain-containing protein n=1 Tax=unclassified Flagellimonas TaxID=2644544 RepID=UPI0013D04BCA|nr:MULTISPECIES: DUF4199 domain-containing protein [unclassified Flagellimonas]UII77255.1 DUF4199 domain-containing protein [Flagellimonas sp. HMM57]
MKKTVFKFGMYGAVAISALFLTSWLALSDLSFSTQEVLGYISIILSLCFVYFGIKSYRDTENNGKISFKKALIIGVLISLIVSIIFGILDVFYIKVINPDFTAEYYESSIETMKASLPKMEFEAKLAEMESQKALFANPLFSFAIMATTVFVIGFIISLISALILQRK